MTAPGNDKAARLIVTDSRSHSVRAVTPTGEVLWNSPCPAGASGSATDGAVSKDRPWIAISFSEGVVAVYDVESGKLLAFETLGANQVAWTRAGNDHAPRLIVDGCPLRAFDLQDDPAESRPRPPEGGSR